jgi:hypothetical protein
LTKWYKVKKIRGVWEKIGFKPDRNQLAKIRRNDSDSPKENAVASLHAAASVTDMSDFDLSLSRWPDQDFVTLQELRDSLSMPDLTQEDSQLRSVYMLLPKLALTMWCENGAAFL